jgi:hypothetical protein
MRKQLINFYGCVQSRQAIERHKQLIIQVPTKKFVVCEIYYDLMSETCQDDNKITVYQSNSLH